MPIIANYSDIPSGYIPIQYSEEHKSFYFDINVLENQVTRFWVNTIEQDLNISDPYFIYDFFGSGEIYINLPADKSLIAVSARFAKFYISHFLTESGVLKNYPKLPYTPIKLTLGEAVPMLSPNSNQSSDSELVAWYFIKTDYFYIISSPATVKSIPSSPPVCEYYSCNSQNVKIISPHYKFANVPDSIKSCSHPNISENSFNVCPFQSAPTPVRQDICAMYKPLTKVVKSTLINIYNTTESYSIDLQYSLCLDGSHSFSIYNTQNNQAINTFNYPSESNYDEILFDLEKVYFEYISCYVNDNLSDVDLNSSKNNTSESKESYILSLLGS